MKAPPFLFGKYPASQAQWKAVVILPKVEQELDADFSRYLFDRKFRPDFEDCKADKLIGSSQKISF